MKLEDNIDDLPRTSGLTINRLKSLGIKTIFDLINYFPSRYEDYSLVSKIKDIQIGETPTVVGQIVEGKYRITRNGTRIQAFKLEDGTGEIELIFYNQPYLLRLLKKGMTVSIAGQAEKFGKKISITPKEYEIVLDNNLKHTGKIIPVYPAKRGLSTKTIREKIYGVLPLASGIEEILPEKILSFNMLAPENYCYQQIHYPKSKEAAVMAKNRLVFDELFTVQLSSAIVKEEWKKDVAGKQFKIGAYEEKIIDDFIDGLPFELTNSQKKVWQEIKNDLIKKTPMNRFLQGEVGSGKTVIAAIASLASYLNGYSTLFMAPTEILAMQHFETISKLFKKNKIKVGLITGSSKPKNIKALNIIIGTHALISKKIEYEKVGLVIVDEQHRFGVAQRASLKSKGINPHLLTMTATPIPRTVALTLYGELDLSVIDEMPKNRLPIKTYYILRQKRLSCYEWIKKQIDRFKVQAYIVCPLVEESDVETMKSIKAAKSEFEKLQKEFFSKYKLGLLHGKLKSKEKEKVVNDFKNGKYDILVTTPVVEVGVDIPNATIMIIEAGERFGLAQLHQLRGRVGRGSKQSYCFVFSETANNVISDRLSFFAKTFNGSLLAQRDLEIRGPGNIYGLEQHGVINLKIANLGDYEIIKKTKNAVAYFMSHYKLENYKALKKRVDINRARTISKD